MVIHQFNRLIRNKWLWGTFAVAISFFFAFDFLLTDRTSGAKDGTAGKLGDDDYSAKAFNDLVSDIRGFGRGRDNKTPAGEVNRQAWEQAAALKFAEKYHLTASDAEVRAAIRNDPSFQGEGGVFNFNAYSYLLRENGFTEEGFEAYLKRRITLNKVARTISQSASWVAPAMLECSINDVTDKFTVRVAEFTDKNAAKVKVTDADIESYYKDNTNSIALPDCVTVKYVRFAADAPARLAQFKITEDEMRDHYDATVNRFETQTTNGVVTKKFEEVKGILEKELQLIASLEAYRTNLLFRVYPQDAKLDEKVDRLEEIAKAEKAKVVTSGSFALGNEKFVLGFMVRSTMIAPGCPNFADAVAELDPESPDLRYGVVAGTNAVYLIERASFTKAHVPSFAEAKEILRPRALANARAKAFKAAVEKKRGALAAHLAAGKPFDANILAATSVSTSLTFAVSSLGRAQFVDSMYVAPAVMKLTKGKISEFIPTQIAARGLVAYVENRVPGSAAEAQLVRASLRDDLSSLMANKLPAKWNAWNLSRFGFVPAGFASTEVVAADEYAE